MIRVFTEDIKDICLNNPPEGSTSEDFNVVEEPAYGVLMYDQNKEARALEVLFTATGRAWHEAKRKTMENEA